MYIASEISNSITVLHRKKGSRHWQFHQTLRNDDINNSRGIRNLALLLTDQPLLASTGAHSRDLVIYQVSARPKFDQKSYELDYYEGEVEPVGLVNVSVPDGGAIIGRRVEIQDFTGNLTARWQGDNKLSLYPELPVADIPSPLLLRLTAIDAEFQNTSVSVAVDIHPDLPPDYTKYFIAGGVAIGSLIAMGGAIKLAMHARKQAKKGREYSPRDAERGNLYVFYDELPGPEVPGDGGCMEAVQIEPVIPVIVVEPDEQPVVIVETPAAVSQQEPAEITSTITPSSVQQVTQSSPSISLEAQQSTRQSIASPIPMENVPLSLRGEFATAFASVTVSQSVTEYPSKVSKIRRNVFTDNPSETSTESINIKITRPASPTTTPNPEL